MTENEMMILFATLIAILMIEAYLGKTKKISANSILELMNNTILTFLGIYAKKKLEEEKKDDGKGI